MLIIFNNYNFNNDYYIIMHQKSSYLIKIFYKFVIIVKNMLYNTLILFYFLKILITKILILI